MKVRRIHQSEKNEVLFEIQDDEDQPVEIVSGFMRHLHTRDLSPNTLSAYAYDLLHFLSFLKLHQLTYLEFTPVQALDLLAYLRAIPSRKHVQRLSMALCTTEAGQSATPLSAASINRVFATVSSFYEYLILSGQFTAQENPFQKIDDPVAARVPERHQAFMGHASQQRPIRRVVRVKTASRVPRPMKEEHVKELLGSLRLYRDKAMILLMLQGGLRLVGQLAIEEQ